MGASHKEFFRLLPIALGTSDFKIDGQGIDCDFGDRQVHIEIGAEGVRKIALLSIPTTDVSIRLIGFDDQAAKDFMANFDRAYQRGGG